MSYAQIVKAREYEEKIFKFKGEVLPSVAHDPRPAPRSSDSHFHNDIPGCEMMAVYPWIEYDILN